MVDALPQEDLYRIRKACEEAIATTHSYEKVSKEMKISLSEFNLGQLNGIKHWSERINELVTELIADRNKKGDLK